MYSDLSFDDCSGGSLDGKGRVYLCLLLSDPQAIQLQTWKIIVCLGVAEAEEIYAEREGAGMRISAVALIAKSVTGAVWVCSFCSDPLAGWWSGQSPCVWGGEVLRQAILGVEGQEDFTPSPGQEIDAWAPIGSTSAPEWRLFAAPPRGTATIRKSGGRRHE